MCTAFKDHKLDAEADLGLRFMIRVPAVGWIGKNLQSPWFKASELHHGLWAWQQLRDARGMEGNRRGPIAWQLIGTEASKSSWVNVQDTYLGFLRVMGNSRAAMSAAARLEGLEEAFRCKMDREAERWNRGAMSRADAASRKAERWVKQSKRHAELQMGIERRIIGWLVRWRQQTCSMSVPRARQYRIERVPQSCIFRTTQPHMLHAQINKRLKRVNGDYGENGENGDKGENGENGGNGDDGETEGNREERREVVEIKEREKR